MIFLTVVHVQWEDHLVHPVDSHVQHTLCNNTENSSENLLIFNLSRPMSSIYGTPSKARNANVYVWTYVWQR